MRYILRAIRCLCFSKLLLTGAISPQALLGEENKILVEGSGRCATGDMLTLRGGTLRLENDLFTGTDQNYTNGIGVTLISRDLSGILNTDCLPAPIRLHAQLIKAVNPAFWSDADDASIRQNVVAKFGQSMYTPEDYSRERLITDDRPYAGLLYIGMAWNRRKTHPDLAWEVLDTREITLGMIGPWSLSEHSQNMVHDMIGSERFLGWDNQLRNEPAFQLALDHKVRRFHGTGAIIPGFSADIIRSYGLRVGNIETSATWSMEGRWGWNVPIDFGSYPIRPGAENRPPSAASILNPVDESTPTSNRPRSGIHFFTTLEAKLVAWDFSLDGNLFRSSHSVTRRPWVVQAGVGISAQRVIAGRGYKLALMRVYRSREFEQQTRNQSFGSIAFSIEF